VVVFIFSPYGVPVIIRPGIESTLGLVAASTGNSPNERAEFPEDPNFTRDPRPGTGQIYDFFDYHSPINSALAVS
jgi:hypothetical protein